MKQLLILLFSSILFLGCSKQPQIECPKYNQQTFPIQEYKMDDINISYWKEGDENKTFIILEEKDFSSIVENFTYYKESLKNLIINIKTYNSHIESNNKE